MGEISFESAISAMSGETKQNSTMIERIFEDVIKNNIRVNIQFTVRYTEIVNYIKSLGWTPNCLEWNYEFDNNVKLQVLSTSSGYTLTVSMNKVPVIKYPERTFISTGVLTQSEEGERKFVLCKHCDNRINYEDYSYTYLMEHFNNLDFESKIDSTFICSLREDNWDVEIGFLVTVDEVKKLEAGNKGAPVSATCNMNTGLIYCPKKVAYFNFYIVREGCDKFSVNMERRDIL